MAHPLINPAVVQNVQRGDHANADLWSSAVSFDERECAAASDHRVNDRALVPAALLLKKAQAALGERQGPISLSDIRFLRPISREEMNHCGLSIRLRRGLIPGEHTLEIVSDAGVCVEALVVDRSDGDEDLFAAANTRQTDGGQRPAALAGGWYEALAARGNAFGESLQLIREILVDEVTPRSCHVQIAPSLESACVLDACFHAVLAGDRAARKSHVLHSIGAIAFGPGWLAGQGRPFHCEVRYAPSVPRFGITADLRVFASDGALALEVRGISFVEIEAGDARSAVAVAATFGTEPLREAVDRLGRDLGIALSAAPYDQVCQSLLRGTSAFDRQDFKELFLFVRLQSWWKARPLTKGPEHAAAVECGGTARTLPNGQEILELNRYETDHLYQEIFDEQVYWRAGGSELRPGDVVLDVGANIGMFSLNLLERCPGARIVAFEPSPVTAAILRANVAGRGAVAVEQKGVGAEKTRARFRHYEKSTVFSGYSTEPDADARTLRSIFTHALHEQGYADVSDADLATLMSGRLQATEFDTPMVSISDVIDERGLEQVALLKIDAEKSEMAILRGIRAEHWPRIARIVLELHEGAEATFDGVRELLCKQGFEISTANATGLEGSGLSLIVARRPMGPVSAVNSPDALGLEEPLDGLVDALREFRRGSSVPVTVVIAPESGKAASSAHVLAEHARVTQRLSARCAPVSDVRVLSWREIDELYPTTDREGSAIEQEAGIPYNRTWYAAAGAWVLRQHVARVRKPNKVIVVDCDDTLWEGACAEVGAREVRVAGRHRALQEWLLRMREQGMFVCLSSKNDEADVLEVLRTHEDMLLRPRDIAAMRVSWDAKSRSIASLAEELNVGLDSVIFIDNNPVECAEVAAHCPDVLALTFPEDDARAARFLRHVWAFDRAPQAGSIDRTGMHRAEMQRRQARSASQSFRQYLESLQLQVDFTAACADDLERISDLSRRTNQFTLDRRTFSVAELTAFLAQAGCHAWVVRASDRFGDYGTVGAVLAEVSGDTLIVSSLMLSCRVLGRGVERRLMLMLAGAAEALGLEHVHLRAISTGRNAPALQFLDRLPARKRAGGIADSVYEIGTAALSQSAAGEYDDSRAAEVADDAPKPNNRETGAQLWEERYRDPQWLERMAESTSTAEDLAARIWGAPALIASNDEPDILENRVCAQWRAALGRDVPDHETSFFALGGTSLQLVFVLNQLSRTESCRLSLSDAYAAPTVRGMVSLVRQAQTAGEDATHPVAQGHSATVLSGAQQSLWFLFLADRRNATFNVSIALQLRGEVRADFLQQTLESLVSRHSALSTAYQLKGKETRARWLGKDALSWQETDATSLDDAQLMNSLAERADRPIDLSAGPIVRAELFTRAPDCRVLLLVTHHIAADFDSMILIVEELARACGAPARPVSGEIAAQYADHVHAEAARLSASRLEELETFWAHELRGAPDTSVVSPATVAQLRAAAGGDSVIVLTSEQTAIAVSALAAKLGVSRLVLLMASYGLFLRAELGAEDLVIGTPVSMRAGAAFERTVGNFVNLVPLRLKLDGVSSLAEAAGVASTALRRSLPSADLPLHRILRCARTDAARGEGVMTLRTTLAMHGLQTTWPSTNLLAHGRVSEAFPFGSSLEANVIGLRQQAGHCEVAVDVFDLGARLAIDVKYSTRRIDRAAAERFGKRFESFLEALVMTGADDSGM